MVEYLAEFTQQETSICFLLSFFTGGLPEKFAANFVNAIIEQPNPNWGTLANFCTGCKESFRNPNKRTNVENQLGLLKQGGKTAEEFFQEFEQLKIAAQFTDPHHKTILIKYLHKAIRTSTINNIHI